MNHDIQELKEKMRGGVVNFTYKKKDGTTREANGTTNLDLIPEDNHPKGAYIKPVSIVNYWDVDKEAWRSFKEENFVKINGYAVKSKRYEQSNLI